MTRAVGVREVVGVCGAARAGGVRGTGGVAEACGAHVVTELHRAGGVTGVRGAGAVPDSFGIAVPGTWTRYDLPEDGSGSARAEIRRGPADVPGGQGKPCGPGGTPDGPGGAAGVPEGPVGGRADEAVRDTRRVLEGARRRGALYAAGSTPSDGNGPLTAGVMIFSVTPPPGEAVSAHALARRFPAAGRRWARGGAQTFSTETLPRVGPVRRLMGVEEGELADGAPYRLLVMHTVVPVPGCRRVLIVLCFSPDLPLIVRAHDLFDTVTATFSFGYGPPTVTG